MIVSGLRIYPEEPRIHYPVVADGHHRGSKQYLEESESTPQAAKFEYKICFFSKETGITMLPSAFQYKHRELETDKTECFLFGLFLEEIFCSCFIVSKLCS